MTTTPGQRERRTQERVVDLFCGKLGYDYLGYWKDRLGNRNIEESELERFLQESGTDEALISRATYLFNKAAGDTSRSLYDRNRDVYELLRYGVNVKTSAGETTQTVRLIDWKNPRKNHFAMAEVGWLLQEPFRTRRSASPSSENSPGSEDSSPVSRNSHARARGRW